MTGEVWSDPRYEAVSRLVTARTGLALPANCRALLERGIARDMSQSGAADPGEYLALLTRSAWPLTGLIDALTIGETFFFRDHAHFLFIRQTVLPELRRRRGPQHVAQTWSAGCASGEEAYSLAILFEDEGLSAQARILATDISHAALAKARAASYGAWSMRNWSGPPVERYFRRQGTHFLLAPRLRDRVVFAPLSLAVDAYPGQRPDAPEMDLILCRNVLIYLDPARLPEVARRFYDALAEGGWLMTGPSDPLLVPHAPFQAITTAAGIVYRRLAQAKAEPAPPPPLPEPPESPPESIDAAPEPAIIGASYEAARSAFARGDYAEVLALSRNCDGDAAASELRILALANLGEFNSAVALAATAARNELCPERHLLHASTLMAARRYGEAAEAARRALYLDRTLPEAHLILGSILNCLGDTRAGERALRNAAALAAARPDAALAQPTAAEARS